MSLVARTATLTSCLALTAVPTLAHEATPNGHANGDHHAQQCKQPIVNKAYVVSGTYGATGSFTATKNADGTYTGSVSFTVTKTNHHAKGATGPFSFTNARVRFDSPTATAPVATDRVKVIGKITVARKHCTSDKVGQVTIRKVRFSVPKSA